MATNNCISSARRLAVVLFALGVTAFLIVLSEYDRQKRVALFGYIEKVFTTQQAIGAVDWTKPSESTSGTSDWRLLEILNKETNAAAILQVAKEVPKLGVYFRKEPPRTRADPLNECPIRILTFPLGEKKVEVGITRGRSQDAFLLVPLQNIFLIGFDETCTLPGMYTEPAVIMRLSPDRETWAVALSTEILKELRSVASPPQTIRRGITPGASAAETAIPRDVKDAIYFEDLKSFIFARAKLETGRTYESNEVPKALDDLLAALDPKPTVLGMPLPSKIAVLVFPSLFLGLALVLWHRVRRIPKSRSDGNEPWIMLHPEGWVETVMALGWSFFLLAAGAFIAWAEILLSPLWVTGSAENIAKWGHIANLALIVVAEVVLLISLGNVLRINAGRSSSKISIQHRRK